MISCISYTVNKSSVGIVTVPYTDCSGQPGSVDVGNVEGGPSTRTLCARNGSVTTPTGVSLPNNGTC